MLEDSELNGATNGIIIPATPIHENASSNKLQYQYHPTNYSGTRDTHFLKRNNDCLTYFNS